MWLAKPMNHFAFLTHNPSGPSLTDFLSELVKTVGKSHIASYLSDIATTYVDHIYLNHKVKFTCAGRESWLWYKFSGVAPCQHMSSWHVSSVFTRLFLPPPD